MGYVFVKKSYAALGALDEGQANFLLDFLSAFYGRTATSVTGDFRRRLDQDYMTTITNIRNAADTTVGQQIVADADKSFRALDDAYRTGDTGYLSRVAPLKVLGGSVTTTIPYDPTPVLQQLKNSYTGIQNKIMLYSVPVSGVYGPQLTSWYNSAVSQIKAAQDSATAQMLANRAINEFNGILTTAANEQASADAQAIGHQAALAETAAYQADCATMAKLAGTSNYWKNGTCGSYSPTAVKYAVECYQKGGKYYPGLAPPGGSHVFEGGTGLCVPAGGAVVGHDDYDRDVTVTPGGVKTGVNIPPGYTYDPNTGNVVPIKQPGFQLNEAGMFGGGLLPVALIATGALGLALFFAKRHGKKRR